MKMLSTVMLGVIAVAPGCQNTAAHRQADLLERIADQNDQIIALLDARQHPDTQASHAPATPDEMDVVGEINGTPIHLYQVLNAVNGRTLPMTNRQQAIEDVLQGVVTNALMREGVETMFSEKELNEIHNRSVELFVELEEAGGVQNDWRVYPSRQARFNDFYTEILMHRFTQRVVAANSEELDRELDQVKARAEDRGDDPTSVVQQRRSELVSRFIYRAHADLMARAKEELIMTPIDAMAKRVDELVQ